MRKTLIALTLASTLATTAGMAASAPYAYNNHEGNNESTSWNQHEGFYAGAAVGTNVVDVHYDHLHYVDSGDFAAALNLGYQFNEHIAIEAGYQRHADLLNVPYLTSKIMLPVAERGTLYTKLGAAYITDDHNDFDLVRPFVGVGGSYALNDKIDLDLQLQGPVDKHAALGLMGVGLTYHFE